MVSVAHFFALILASADRLTSVLRRGKGRKFNGRRKKKDFRSAKSSWWLLSLVRSPDSCAWY